MIQTKRSTLTELRETDLESIVRLNTDPEVRRYLGGSADEQMIRARFPKLLTDQAVAQKWAIRATDNDSFIGAISLGPHHDGVDTEVSYLLLPEWWGQGYATESVQAILDYGLSELGLARIIAETQTANEASIRLLKRLGMEFEHTLERFGEDQSIYTTKSEG